MMTGASAKRKPGGSPINIDWLSSFVHSSPDSSSSDVCFVSPPPAAGKGKAPARSPLRSLNSYRDPPPPPPAHGKGKRGREADGEFFGMSNEGALLRDVRGMSDGELQREIAGIPTFARLLSTEEKREGRRRLLRLLEDEARRRRIRTAAPKDGDDRNRGAPSSDVYTFDIDELTDDAAHRYCRDLSPIRPMNANYGRLGVHTRTRSKQTGPMNPIAVDKMYSGRTSPTALGGHKMRVRAVDPKERENKKSRQNEINNYGYNAMRRKAHHKDSSLLHQKVNDVVLLDEEDVQLDEPVDCGVLDKWKDLKIYYPSSDDPGAVELSSLDIKCLNPGVYLSSPVINYYIQYIKRAKMHIKDGTDKFYMFNTYFYSKLQEALLDKSKFLKLRRWWKGVNIFQRGYIVLPIHGASHWSLIIVCMPAKESNSGPIILHLDSLGMHPSAEIFDTVGGYLEEEWRHLRKNSHSDISLSETIWQDLPRNIRKEKVEVPGQNNAYDCGVFMLYYIQQFIRQAPERFTRDSLDMFSRSWFRSEDASGLRKVIRELLLQLFGNARVDDNMSEAPASDGSDEECIIKEGESEAVIPCDNSGMAVVGGDTSTHNEENFMEDRPLEGTPLPTCRSDGRMVACALSEAAMVSDGIDGADTMKTDFDNSNTVEDVEIIPSDGIDGDDTMKTDFDNSNTVEDVEILPSDGSGMAVGGGGTS